MIKNLKDLVVILLVGGVLTLLGVIIIGDYYVALQDLTFFAFSYLRVNFNYNDTNQAKEIFYKILDDETSNNMPLDIIDEAKKSFDENQCLSSTNLLCK